MNKGYIFMITGAICVCLFILAVYAGVFTHMFSAKYSIVAKDQSDPKNIVDATSSAAVVASTVPLDINAYNAKLLAIANDPPKLVKAATTSTTAVYSTPTWPVKTASLPNAGALLPFNRIVAYYGNFYSTAMGVLGQYPPDQMMTMLASTTAQWQAADPNTPVIPALDYIAR
jgi:hypothetical protein